jgi:hypothetical protein
MFDVNIMFFIKLSNDGTFEQIKRVNMYEWEAKNGVKQETPFML